ncbi:MAG: hypothetical protein ACI9OJ_002976 [Myxococcota bacterium]
MKPAGDGILTSALLTAVVLTVLIHVGLGYTLHWVESDVTSFTMPAPFKYVRAAPARKRGGHGGVAFERRRIDSDCNSIPECEPNMEPQVIELKIAKLGGKEPDPTELPEIQKYEAPEKIEEAVNLVEPVKDVKPLPFRDFIRKKAQLDKRRRKKPKKVKNLFNLNDKDPRARPTRFERITGRLDGDVMGKGTEQERFDTYIAKVAYELQKAFVVPTSLSKKQIRRHMVRVLVKRLGADGSIASYVIKRRAKNKAFTLAAEAAIKSFVPSEGGRKRFPPPPADFLAFANKKGLLIDLDGRLFE